MESVLKSGVRGPWDLGRFVIGELDVSCSCFSQLCLPPSYPLTFASFAILFVGSSHHESSISYLIPLLLHSLWIEDRDSNNRLP
jgi:hypothetical protein